MGKYVKKKKKKKKKSNSNEFTNTVKVNSSLRKKTSVVLLPMMK